MKLQNEFHLKPLLLVRNLEKSYLYYNIDKDKIFCVIATR